MLVLINTNVMQPPIGPIGLDYVAGAARAGGIETRVVDLCLADDGDAALRGALAAGPSLVGLTFRNLDDCFWPSCRSFADELASLTARVRELTDAPIVLGGVGFSVMPGRILRHTGADFGIHGDGEQAVCALHHALAGRGRLEDVPGLLRRENGRTIANPPAWPERLSLPTARDAVDNAAYFRLGGQSGVETKRGCNRRCIYCADPLAKGRAARLRDPREVADEVEALAARGINVLHLCDSEFNIPRAHAMAVCDELTARGLTGLTRWYAYLAVTPFDEELASAMQQAGCVGIDFTTDSASPAMLMTYGHGHSVEDIASAVAICRRRGIAVMLDLLLGGPGETPNTAAETVTAIKRLDADCVGCGVGVRLYPGTPVEAMLRAGGPLEQNRGIRRKYDGPVDLLLPTFYVSRALGPQPAGLVRELIGGDRRFFEPADEQDLTRGHNYNDNAPLVRAIAQGHRGAYWHILSKLRNAQ